jgi:hypothetical protein
MEQVDDKNMAKTRLKLLFGGTLKYLSSIW